MIYEYALEPEMVATWGTIEKFIVFFRAFGLGQGRVVSNYPRKWAKTVYTCAHGTVMDRKRLVELLKRIKENMIERRDPIYDSDKGNWIENALLEHKRHPFFAIMARNNHNNLSYVFCENDLAASPCPNWDIPHGIIVNRNAVEMAAAVETMLNCCRWVKFIDPYFSKAKWEYRKSFAAFFSILGSKRPVGSLDSIEIHTSDDGVSEQHLKDFCKEILPVGLTVTLFQWRVKLVGQRLHNRYILTDLGGVAFHHGLDTGDDSETDDITRLDCDQYKLHCTQYNRTTLVFEEAEAPLELIGNMEGEND